MAPKDTRGTRHRVNLGDVWSARLQRVLDAMGNDQSRAPLRGKESRQDLLRALVAGAIEDREDKYDLPELTKEELEQLTS